MQNNFADGILVEIALVNRERERKHVLTYLPQRGKMAMGRVETINRSHKGVSLGIH